jgi:hypothetical protein
MNGVGRFDQVEVFHELVADWVVIRAVHTAARQSQKRDLACELNGARIVNDAERIINGVDRLDIDLWRDVDHEGIGGQSGACALNWRSRSRRQVSRPRPFSHRLVVGCARSPTAGITLG